MAGYNQPGFIIPTDNPIQSQQHQQLQQQQPTYPQYPGYPQAQSQPFNPPNQPTTNMPFPGPIQNQPAAPMAVNWFGPQSDFAAYLSRSKALHISQKRELLELIVGWESPNKYSVRDEFGNKIFYVGEVSNVCGRQLCGNRRPFKLDVKDKNGASILLIDRDLDCDFFCGLFCPDKVRVSAPSGQILGYVTSNISIITPSFAIQDANGKIHFNIEGPICALKCIGSPVNFHVMAKNGTRVGLVSKEWTGLIQEYFTDADNFYVSYPPDLDVSLKAVFMAAAFLIVSISKYDCCVCRNMVIVELVFVLSYSVIICSLTKYF